MSARQREHRQLTVQPKQTAPTGRAITITDTAHIHIKSRAHLSEHIQPYMTGYMVFVVSYPPAVVSEVCLCMCISDQRGHVSSVHLPAGDVLFGLWHGAHLEALRTSGTRADDGRQGDRASFHLPDLIELLLENC